MVRAGGAGMGGAAAATTMPLASFGGHRKAVAYVRWAGEDELLSASTGEHASGKAAGEHTYS
eukprot:scaffold183791_cov14-Tisochrysis_lutea.AAC.1